MTLHVEFWQLVSFAFTVIVAIIGGFWALVQVIVKQFKAHLTEKFRTQDEVRTAAKEDWDRRFDTLERGQKEADARFNKLQAELPEKYQRREDAIRQEVNIISRLDGLAEMMEQKFQATDGKIERLRRAQ